jgi:hypothetical protein
MGRLTSDDDCHYNSLFSRAISIVKFLDFRNVGWEYQILAILIVVAGSLSDPNSSFLQLQQNIKATVEERCSYCKLKRQHNRAAPIAN